MTEWAVKDRLSREDPEAISQKLDVLLFQALLYMKRLPPQQRTTVVAGIFDPAAGVFSIATSRRSDSGPGYGVWYHAEHEALLAARKAGSNLRDSVLVTSLSPCVIPSNHRAHEVSCSQILAEAGVSRIHVGWIDLLQSNVLGYADLGLRVSLTTDQHLQNVCRNLYGYFDLKPRPTGTEKIQYIDAVIATLPETF